MRQWVMPLPFVIARLPTPSSTDLSKPRHTSIRSQAALAQPNVQNAKRSFPRPTRTLRSRRLPRSC